MTQNRQNPKTTLLVQSNFLVLFALSFAPFVTGCGSAAIITRKYELPLEGKIIRSDKETIFVQTFTGHGEVSVARENIADIDHPGNVAATIGGVLSAYGVANIILGASDCDRGGAAYCTGVFLPAAIGGPLLIYGFTVWLSSRVGAASSDASTARRLTVVPIASMDKTNQVFGARARVSF